MRISEMLVQRGVVIQRVTPTRFMFTLQYGASPYLRRFLFDQPTDRWYTVVSKNSDAPLKPCNRVWVESTVQHWVATTDLIAIQPEVKENA